MNKELEDRIYDAALKAQFEVQFFDYYAFFRGYSPSGEDISFGVYKDDYTFDDVFDEVLKYFTYFDVDEHAVILYEIHRKNGAPKDLKKLLEDARYIKIMYQNLYLHMRDLKKELEEE